VADCGGEVPARGDLQSKRDVDLADRVREMVLDRKRKRAQPLAPGGQRQVDAKNEHVFAPNEHRGIAAFSRRKPNQLVPFKKPDAAFPLRTSCLLEFLSHYGRSASPIEVEILHSLPMVTTMPLFPSYFRRTRSVGTVRSGARNVRSPAEAGLTLIEMIVVLAIIALIAGLIVPNVIGRPDEARVTVAASDLKTVSAALKMYRLDNGDYPTTEQGLAALAEKPRLSPVPKTWPSEGYLAEVPRDPWDRPYVYSSGGASGGFELMSLGKDGKPGGEGLDADITLERR